MPLDFPAAPPPLVVGQVYGSWKWDGAKWVAAAQSYATSPYQPGPGLTINAGTTPPTIDVAKPYLPIDGSVAMTGANLLLSADPTASLGAATKNYVDSHAGAVTVSDTAPASPRNGALWFNSTLAQLLVYYTDPNSSQWVQANVTQAAAGLVLPVTVAQGGTGVTTLAANVLPKGAGTGPLASSSITDAGAGVVIGTPAGGAQGAGTLALPGQLLINANTAAAPASGSLLRLCQANGVTNNLVMDAFGTGFASQLFLRFARGTLAAPTAVQNADALGVFGGAGYGATGWGALAATVNAIARENWTDTAQGAALWFNTNTPGTTTRVNRMQILSGVFIGNNPGAQDPGMGGLFLNAHATAAPPAAVPIYRGMNLHFINADNQTPLVLGDASGGATISYSGRVCGGTLAAPTATPNGYEMVSVEGYGYGATGYGQYPCAQLYAQASANWTDASQPAFWALSTRAAGDNAAAYPTTRVRVASGVIIGNASSDPGMGGLVLNANSAPLPLLGTAAMLQAAGPDASNTAIAMTSSGGNGTFYLGRSSRGTLAAPTASQNGDWNLVLNGYGYDGSSYQQSGYITLNTAEAWGASNHGGGINFYTNTLAAGAAGPINRASIQAGVQLLGPSATWPAGGDKGAGTLNANVGLYVNNVAVSTSDERLKDNIRPASRDALAALQRIPLFEYDWRSTGPDDPGRHNAIGFVSQRMPEELGLAVIDDNAAVIDTLQMTAHLVRAVQQLAERLEKAGI